MKVVSVALSSCLILVSTAHAGERGAGSTETLEQCRAIQRAVQTEIGAEEGYPPRARGQAVRTVVRGLHRNGGGGPDFRESCGGCILRQFAQRVPLGEQTPCGSHDRCVSGAALSAADDACVEAVCKRHKACCTQRWDESCVAAVTELCEQPCGICTHSECEEGDALPSGCSTCTQRVCDSDPYCCDTAWDASCAEAATTACAPACDPPTTTTTSTSTTSTTSTSTTMTTVTLPPPPPPPPPPECTAAGDCTDADLCTIDTCGLGTCVHVAIVCDDGKACTVGDRCVAGICIGGPPMDCNDQDPCTLDWCAPVGECRHMTLGCGDGNACTVDFCDRIVGCVRDPVNCDDNNPCTVESCDVVRGCLHTRDDTAPGCSTSGAALP